MGYPSPMIVARKSSPTMAADNPDRRGSPSGKVPLGKRDFKVNTLQPWRHQERKSLSVRFEEKYIPEPMSGCWLWTASIHKNTGYGQIGQSGGRGLRPIEAHRAAWQLYRGEIPIGFDIDHRCRNRSCVNPDHLEPKTRRANILAGIGIPSVNAAKTHCKQGHAFTVENTYTYVLRGNAQRQCRTCRREKDRKRVRIR